MVYYVALPFTRLEDGLAPGDAVECPSGPAAIRRAEALASDKANAGAVAFSRSGDPNLGEFEDAVILKSFGEVPDDFAAPDRHDPAQGPTERRPGSTAAGRIRSRCGRAPATAADTK